MASKVACKLVDEGGPLSDPTHQSFLVHTGNQSGSACMSLFPSGKQVLPSQEGRS